MTEKNTHNAPARGTTQPLAADPASARGTGRAEPQNAAEADSMGAAAVVDQQPNWRYYVAFDEVFDDPNAPFTSNTEAAHRGIDAVVAAVKEHEVEWRRQAIRHAKAIVRRNIALAIRRDSNRAEWALNPQEHAARIAEGNTDRG